MSTRKVDRLIIKVMNLTVAGMGATTLSQSGFWGFKGLKLVGITIVSAIVIYNALKGLQRRIRKATGYYEKGKKRERTRREDAANLVQGTPWTKVQFNPYVQVDRNTTQHPEAV